MPEEKKSRRSKDIAVARAVIKTTADQILSEKIETGIQLSEFDPLNPNELTRTEIFYYYSAHDFDEAPRTPLLKLAEIAEIVIPDYLDINATVAKEIISIVGQEMLRKFLVAKALNEGQQINPYKLQEIDEEVELFNLQRRNLVSQRIVLEKLEEDPEHYRKLAEIGRRFTGNHIWTDEENLRLKQLSETILWPEGTNHFGKPDWKKITEILNQEFDQSFDSKQVESVVEKRRRLERKRRKK